MINWISYGNFKIDLNFRLLIEEIFLTVKLFSLLKYFISTIFINKTEKNVFVGATWLLYLNKNQIRFFNIAMRHEHKWGLHTRWFSLTSMIKFLLLFFNYILESESCWKGLFVNMSTTIIITKSKTLQWIMLLHTITKRLEMCIVINIEIS